MKRACIICGTAFKAKPSHAAKGWAKYCSKNCQFQGQKTGRFFACDECGREVYRRQIDIKKSSKKRFFCSKKCHCVWENKHVRCGENAPNWIAGHNVYRELMKRHRVKAECIRCGLEDKRVLAVHHKDRNRRNNKLENLEWLCHNCNYIVHLEMKAK